MKLCVAGLSLLILMALCCSLTYSAPVGSDSPMSCCFSYFPRKLKQELMTDYYETSSLCSQPAVVFINKKNKQICTNPTESWVQDYMKFLKSNRTVWV